MSQPPLDDVDAILAATDSDDDVGLDTNVNLEDILAEEDEVTDIPKPACQVTRVPSEEYFGSKTYTKNFYGAREIDESQKQYLPIKRKVGQATLIRDQVRFIYIFSNLRL